MAIACRPLGHYAIADRPYYVGVPLTSPCLSDTVKVINIDPSGKVRLSRKVLLKEGEGRSPRYPGGGDAHGPSGGDDRGGRGDRGPRRDRDRGPRR